MNNQNKGNTNTVLIVIVLLLLVAFGVWWMSNRNQASLLESAGNGINIDVKLPDNSGQDSSGGSNQSY